MIGPWNCIKRKKANNGGLGPRGGNDRIQPNKRAHNGPVSGFKGLGGTFVPG